MSNRDLIELIILGIIAVFVAVYFIIKAIKNHWIKELTDTLNEALHYAEENIKEGAAKKQYVLSKIEEKCIELGIPYGFIYKLINKLIEKIVNYHNKVAKGK